MIDNSRVVSLKKHGLNNDKNMLIAKGTEWTGVAVTLWTHLPEVLIRITAETSVTPKIFVDFLSPYSQISGQYLG
jgi:hypothetical protein